MPEIDALLINPISARIIPAFVPHGLLYIASFAIGRGYNIAVYDRNVAHEGICAVLSKLKPHVVGIGCLTGTCIDDAIYVSKKAKEFDSSIKIVWGGIHPTLHPDSVLQEDFVDFVVLGDGEKAFAEILDNVIKNTMPLEKIDGLGYKDDRNNLKYNTMAFLNPEELPQPAWHLVDVRKYIRKKFYADRVIAINTSRGCPYKCSFCCVPKVHQGKWRSVSAEKIIENLKFLKERYGIDGFQVDDDEFDIDRNRVLKLCQLLQANKMDLKWSHFSRINIVNEDVLKEEIISGLRLIEFGVESGSSRILEFLNKGQTVEQIIRAYSICRKLRIKTSALFMVGLPTEGIQDLKETVKLIKRLNPYLTICTIYRPYPGTVLFDYCIENKLFSFTDNLENIGGIYGKDINISLIPGKSIFKVKRSFDLNNIYQEVRFILTSMKFALFFYYLFHYILKPKQKPLE